MRGVFTIVFLIWAGSSTALAQMQQGSWMLDGNLALSRTWSSYIYPGSGGNTEKQDPTTSISFHPSVGFFVKDNLVLGLSTLIGNQWSKDGDIDRSQSLSYYLLKSNTLSYGVGVYMRKYIPTGDKFSFFGEVSADSSWENFGGTYGDQEDRTVLSKGRVFTGRAGLGLQYLLSKKVGMHVQTNVLEYSVGKSNYQQSEYGRERSTFSVGFNQSFVFGGSIFF